MLEAFGVGPVAEAAYLTMLQHPNAGVTELSERLGVTEQVVREALDELARLSLLRPSWDDPLMLRPVRSEEHTSELQSRRDLVCRLLLEKKKDSRKRETVCVDNSRISE